MKQPATSRERLDVAAKAERVLRDHFVSTGQADTFALPKDYEEAVLALERAGLLVTNLAACQECENPAIAGEALCRGHRDLAAERMDSVFYERQTLNF